MAQSLSSTHGSKRIQAHSAASYVLLGHTPGFTVIQTHDREAISLNVFSTGVFGSFAVVAVRTFEITEIICQSVMDMYCSQDLPGTTLAVFSRK